MESDENDTDLITTIVAPDGLDDYPKYSIYFGDVLEFSSYEEACAPEKQYQNLDFCKGLSSYQWLDSPSIIAYRRHPITHSQKGNNSLNHYVLFGIDNIVEVVTQNQPKITKINEPTLITIDLKI